MQNCMETLNSCSITNNLEKIYLCPSTSSSNCEWEGNISDIAKHFHTSHSELLMDSTIVKVNINRDSKENRLIVSEKRLFLVQTRVSRQEMKLYIYLRSLNYGNNDNTKITYGIEIITGMFAFVNEISNEVYNPVHNTTNGIEVDIQAIRLISKTENIEHLDIKINIVEETPDYSEKIIDKISSVQKLSNETNLNYLDAKNNNDNDFHSREFDESDDYDDKLSQDYLEDLELHSALKYIEESSEEYESFSKDMIMCTNCTFKMIPPIYMCPEGHSVCANCKCDNCYVCNQNITDLRNIDLEEYSKTLKYTCRYKAQGCSGKYSYNEIGKHEIHCDYCIYKCELCTYEGKYLDIRTHFRIAHPSTKIYDTMTRIHFPRGSNFVIMNGSGVFYCSSFATDTYVEWRVVFCGPQERNFNCEVQVIGKKHIPTKHYFLNKTGNQFKWSVPFDELRSANIKEKNSFLFISDY